MGRTEVTGRQIKDQTVALTEDVSGVLPVANGGSGSDSLPMNSVILGNGSGAVQTVAPGSSGNLLTSVGGTWVSSTPAAGAGSGDVTSAESSSVDSEVALYSSTTGKQIKRATGSGIAKLTSGVLSTISSPAGDIVGTTDTQTLSGKTISGSSNTVSDIPQSAVTGLTSDLSAKEDAANKNEANGFCGLDGSGKVAAAQLPSYVDDILEFASEAGFPATGESGKIFVDQSNGKVFRWTGSAYAEISPSPGSTDAVAEGATNLYFTNARADARISTAVSTLTNPTINGFTEGSLALGTVGASATLSIVDDSVITATLTASTATTFAMPPVALGKSFTLMLRQAAATGNGTATFTAVKWPTSGAPTITATAGRMDILSFFSDGINWYGSAGQGYTP